MDQLKKTRIIFYDGFLDTDWYCLPESVQRELLGFLEELQDSPDEPHLRARCDVDKKGRLAYPLPDRYWLYLRIEVDRAELSLTDSREFRINVLDVRHLPLV